MELRHHLLGRVDWYTVVAAYLILMSQWSASWAICLFKKYTLEIITVLPKQDAMANQAQVCNLIEH